MMGAMQQGPFPQRGVLGAEAVVEFRPKRKAREMDKVKAGWRGTVVWEALKQAGRDGKE